MTTRQQLKDWFSNLKKPNQNQFWAWIDSFVHKEDKISMDSIEGLDKALQDTASDAKLEGHLTDEQAHQALFAQKVDKEDGKGLSANDYSDQEKQKVHDTADKVIISGSVTGDVNKILTLTYSDSTTLKIPFKDLGIENVADIMLNSLNFNHETGVLTGLRSDGQQLTVNLDGRYAFVGHTHSYNDLEDKPTLLPEAPNDGNQYVRHNKTWKAFTGWQFKELGTENLNNIKVPGFYGKYNSGEATTARNYPYDAIRGGHLLVLPMTTNSNTLTIFQVYFSAGTQNSGDYTHFGRMFFRAFVNNKDWLPWVEFGGGKVHNYTSIAQNLSQAFNGAFPNNESTFVLEQGTTITVPQSRQVVRYIKNTEEPIVFNAESDVTLLNGGTVNSPKGSLIYLVCFDDQAFVWYEKPQTNTDDFIQKTDEANAVLLANGATKPLDEIQHTFTGNSKQFVDGTGQYQFLGKKQRTDLDLTSLDDNTWYLVTSKLPNSAKHKFIIQAALGLNSAQKPPYASHDLGISVFYEFDCFASGWGTQQFTLIRNIEYAQAWLIPNERSYPLVTQTEQMSNSSNQYFYVRGGAKYAIYTSGFDGADVPITLHTDTGNFEASRQSIPKRMDKETARGKFPATFTDIVRNPNEAILNNTNAVMNQYFVIENYTIPTLHSVYPNAERTGILVSLSLPVSNGYRKVQHYYGFGTSEVITRNFSNNSWSEWKSSKDDFYVINVTSNLVLTKEHVGRTLQFNNNSNITIDISNFPTGAMLSGVKNNTGNVTFVGTTAPISDNVLSGNVNSSFSLIKNASGVSNLLINNK